MTRVVQVREEKVMAALNEETSRRILSRCIGRAIAAKEISERTAIPLPSVYRRLRELVDDGLLYIERSALTPDGKPYDLYRSAIKRCRIEVLQDKIEVSWDLNVSLDARLSHMWESLRK